MHFDYCTTASMAFVLLDEFTFKDILQHSDMTVTSEEKVLDAIMMWCMQASESCGWAAVDELLASLTPEQLFKDRLPSVNHLVPLVRFPLMPVPLLEKLKKSRLCSNFPLLEQLVNEATECSGMQVMVPAIKQNIRFQHRKSSYRELQYICDGDSNGVIYFAGTSYGQHPWFNPVLLKKLSVTASSPPSRYTDPKALVSRMYQATSFAGPRTIDGSNFSWWMVDIGQDHQLMCNYYTLRQDGSATYFRSWALQGSIDGENWIDLSVHKDDRTICQPGQFASWPIQGPTSLLPFRFFRVTLTGPTTSQSNPWNFCICFIELYGYFR